MKNGLFSLSVLAAALLMAAFASLCLPMGQAACPVGGCGSGGESWTDSAQAFINSDVPIVGVTSGQSVSSSFKAGSIAANSTGPSEASATAANEAASAASSSTTTTNTRKFLSSSSGYSFQAGPEGGSFSGQGANATAAEGTAPAGNADAVKGVYVAPGSRADKFPEEAAEILKALDAVSEDEVVLDVSSGHSAGHAHLRGAASIPYKDFFYENGSLRSIPELASILGRAGITEREPVMVYSDTFASGEATAVLWVLSYLGHEQAKALDGGLDNWIGASLPLESLDAGPVPAAVYNASPKKELLADYDYVMSERAQLVDARSFQEWGEDRIGNATWISAGSVGTEGRLRAGDELKDTFARLETERPVVVYSDDICEASVVWFALRVMGYDARIYRLEER